MTPFSFRFLYCSPVWNDAEVQDIDSSFGNYLCDRTPHETEQSTLLHILSLPHTTKKQQFLLLSSFPTTTGMAYLHSNLL